MAKVITTELQRDGASGPNITLDTSKNVTCENNLTVDGTSTLTGAVTLPDNTITNAKVADDAIGVAELSATGTASSSTFLRGDNAWAAAGGGVILQVVSIAQQTSALDTSSTGSVASGYTGAITPTTSGNKILVQLSGRLMLNSSDAHAAAYIKDVTNGTFSSIRTAIARNSNEEHYTMWHLFTTTSTSAHTYEMYQQSADSGSKVWNEAQMLLWEVAV